MPFIPELPVKAWETGPDLGRIFVHRVAKSKSARIIVNLLRSLQFTPETSILLLESFFLLVAVVILANDTRSARDFVRQAIS